MSKAIRAHTAWTGETCACGRHRFGRVCRDFPRRDWLSLPAACLPRLPASQPLDVYKPPWCGRRSACGTSGTLILRLAAEGVVGKCRVNSGRIAEGVDRHARLPQNASQRLQLVDEFGHGLLAVIGLFGQHRLEDCVELIGDVVAGGAQRWDRF